MTERSTHHATFTIDRTFAAPPARVFKAWSDPAAKAGWFSGPNGWKQNEREMDFRIGGRELVSGTWPDGRVTTYDSRFWDIVPEQRIISTYDMHMNQDRISVSLVTIELAPEGAGTRMKFTEQLACLDGYIDQDGRERERGTRGVMDALEASLKDA